MVVETQFLFRYHGLKQVAEFLQQSVGVFFGITIGIEQIPLLHIPQIGGREYFRII